MDSSDAKHTLIDDWMNEFLIGNGYTVPGNTFHSKSERVWIMLMLKKGRSILNYDESRLPLLIKILQELIEKIEEPELRCKIINCLLSTKLKIALNVYQEMCKPGNVTESQRIFIIEKLLLLDERFVDKLSKKEEEEVTAHIQELKDLILFKSDIIGQIHAERGAKQACIDELEEVTHGVLQICGKGFLEKVANAIMRSGETTHNTRDEAQTNGERTTSEENGISCLATEKRSRKSKKSSMKSKIIKVRETVQNDSCASKESEMYLPEERTLENEGLNSLEKSPEMQPLVAFDRKQASLSSKAPETPKMTDVASDVNIRGHGRHNNAKIKTYSKADNGYEKRHDAISGSNVWVDENKEIAPTEKRDSYFKTRSSALLELSPVKLKSISPKRASYFKTRSSAMLDVSPVRLKSTRLQTITQNAHRRGFEGSDGAGINTACGSRIQTAGSATRRQARRQRDGGKRIEASDGVGRQTACGSRIQAAAVTTIANPFESSSQETNSTPEASVPSTASSPSSRCSSSVSDIFLDRKHQALGALGSGQRTSTDSSYFASAESSSTVASKELSALSLPLSIDLAKVKLNKLPVSINRAKLSLNFASTTFMKDSDRVRIAANGEIAPGRNEWTTSHSRSAQETIELSPEYLPIEDATAQETIELSPEYLPIEDATSTCHLAFHDADMPSGSSTATSSQEHGSDDIGLDLRPGAAWSDLCRAEEQSQKIALTGSSDEATSSASIIKQSPEARALATSNFYSKKPVSINSQSQRVAASGKLNRAKRKLVTWTESPRSKALRLLSGNGKKGRIPAKKSGALKEELEKLKRNRPVQRFVVSTKLWNHKRKKEDCKVDELCQGSSSSKDRYRCNTENDRSDDGSNRSNIQGFSRKVMFVDNNRKRSFHERTGKDVQNKTNISGDSQNHLNDEVTENCTSPLLFASTPKSSSLSTRGLDSNINASFASSRNPNLSSTPSAKPKLASRFVDVGSKPDQFYRTVGEIDGEMTDASSGTQTLSSGGSSPYGSLQRSNVDLKFLRKESCRNKLLDKIDKEMQALGTVMEDTDARKILKNASLAFETNGDDISQRVSMNRSFQILDRTEQSSGTISIESSRSKTSGSDLSSKGGLFGSKDSISAKLNHEDPEMLSGLKSSKEVSKGDRVLVKLGKAVTSSTIAMLNTLREKEACTESTGETQLTRFDIKPRRRLAVSKSIREVISSHESSPTSKGATLDATDHNNNFMRRKVSLRDSLPTSNGIATNAKDENNNFPMQSKNRPARNVNNEGTTGDCVLSFQNNTPETESDWTVRNINNHQKDGGKKPLQCIIEKAATRYPSIVADDTMIENARSFDRNDNANDPLRDRGSMEFDSFMSLIDESHSNQQNEIISKIDKQKTVIEISDTDSDSLNEIENGVGTKRFSKFANERLNQYPDCISLSSCSDLSLNLSESLG